MDISLLNNLSEQIESIAKNMNIQIQLKLNDENISNEDKETALNLMNTSNDVINALKNKDINKLTEIYNACNVSK